jgi:hypothetical protein
LPNCAGRCDLGGNGEFRVGQQAYLATLIGDLNDSPSERCTRPNHNVANLDAIGAPDIKDYVAAINREIARDYLRRNGREGGCRTQVKRRLKLGNLTLKARNSGRLGGELFVLGQESGKPLLQATNIYEEAFDRCHAAPYFGNRLTYRTYRLPGRPLHGENWGAA